MMASAFILLVAIIFGCAAPGASEAPPASDVTGGVRRGDGRHGAAYRGYVAQRLHPCDQSSCYPATGNLLIGREDRLSATSTCGLRGQERYCIVSHLEDRKKCFWCDSRPEMADRPTYSHRVENIIYRSAPRTRQRSWWQSENGVENVVIQLDLEAEFHFTHLVITFKTFRPAAMLIERSYDFGRSWHVYRYFADDCASSFPGIPHAPPSHMADVVCERRYSDVAPSTEGEIIFRVLSPNIRIEDPYSPEVQNLLKMTNLRVNLTRLHTLGDDLLDKRLDIQEKYYYSIYEMVVRGSCSCYGHASRCLPLPGVDPRPDMVHGRCECTHNTKGLNCEECEDFYNDLPWRPALGRQTNACKRCNCNGHATSCHFDHAVYEATGRIGGGVCDSCQHNTIGINCESCSPYFYHNPALPISDPEACQPCDCDPRGSLEDGICDSRTDEENDLLAGRCYCKPNVDGLRCDRCKAGFWQLDKDDPDGCRTCSCNTLGTVGNRGCDVYSGECTCKRYVTGRDCNQCLPEYWGLAQEWENGCQPCACDPGGAYDNKCDVITGQCRCRPHVTGRTCDQAEQRYFAGYMDHFVYEAEIARGTQDCVQASSEYESRQSNCQVVLREPYRDGQASSWTGTGFMRVFEDSHVEFVIQNIATSLEYDLVIRYEPQHSGTWHDVRITVERDGPTDLDGPCANLRPGDDQLRASLPTDFRYVVVHPPICLESGKTYKLRIDFKRFDPTSDTPTASTLIDSISLVPRVRDIPFFSGSPENDRRRTEFEHYRCGNAFLGATKPQLPEICKKHLGSIGFYVFDGAFECGCDPTGSHSGICDQLGGQCNCKPNVVGQRCDRCAPGTYGFGPQGCRPCECHSVGSLDNFCEGQLGQCRCRPDTYGRRCNECGSGWWGFPSCRRCECHGHAEECDPTTGECIDCQQNTAGRHCDRCEEGYYGDPRPGVDIPCRQCPCPGTEDSGRSHASRCALDPITRDVICECKEGHAAPRCDVCSDNYFGNPDEVGGNCLPCDCSDNVDLSRPGNCEPNTGECLKCLFDTEGFRCEHCKLGFYGDALQRQCAQCVCNILGTDASQPGGGACNRQTGQCPCLPNVEGISCDRCAAEHWKIASGEGCEACNCDPLGSYSNDCNEYDGQCTCKEGFGGRQCDQCETNHWGNPKAAQCFACDCDIYGSATMQCDRTSGVCVCVEGIGGDRCDRCARGYLGSAPYCQPCGECFDNWDRIMSELNNETNTVVDAASKIRETGVSGAYAKQFEGMEEKLEKVRGILANTSVPTEQVEWVERDLDRLRAELTAAGERLDSIDESLANTTQRIYPANIALEALKNRVQDLTNQANALKDNATRLQEANVEGALNLTREAWQRGQRAQQRWDGAGHIVADSERQRRGTEILLGRASEQFNRTLEEQKLNLDDLQQRLDSLDGKFPEANQLVCDGMGDPCNPLCGGAGCRGKCGGAACEEGAVNKAEKALQIATDTQEQLKEKGSEADELLRGLSQAQHEAEKAKDAAQQALDIAETAQNRSGNARADIEQLLNKIEDFLDVPGAKPAEIRTLANEVLASDISLQPEQIQELATSIGDTIASLTDIDEILRETAGDVELANHLKRRADAAKEQAENLLKTAQKVPEILDEASQAQERAKEEIRRSEEDVSEAERDLVQAQSEREAAATLTSEGLEDAENLESRLQGLQGRILRTQLALKDAGREAESAGALVDEAQTGLTQLELLNAAATGVLANKEESSAGVKDRALELQERAGRLAANASGQLEELQAMEKDYQDAEVRMRDLSAEIEELTHRMSIYIEDIDGKAKYYRECLS